MKNFKDIEDEWTGYSSRTDWIADLFVSVGLLIILILLVWSLIN